MHTTNTTELTDRAHQIANQFAGEREYAGFADIWPAPGRRLKHQGAVMEWYRMIGILQTQMRGQWSERHVSMLVRTQSADSACETVLGRAHRDALVIDPYTIARWHSPELVRAIQIAEEQP